MTRADYGGLKLHPEQSVFSWTPSSILAQLRYFLSALRKEWGWGAFVFGGVGMASMIADPKAAASEVVSVFLG